jgi:phage replication O-like protein O
MIKSPNYTQIPNVYFDEIMQNLNGSENLVLLVIMRKTFGWQKKKDRISYSQIMNLAGIAKSTTAAALTALEKKGYIKAEYNGQFTFYSVNIDEETVPKIIPDGTNCTENRTGTVPKIVPVLEETVPKIEHTKESNINKYIKADIEKIETAYSLAYKEITNSDCIIVYAVTRKRLKEVLQQITLDQALNVIDGAKHDEWIKSKCGFSFNSVFANTSIMKYAGIKRKERVEEKEKTCDCGGVIFNSMCKICGAIFDSHGNKME